MDLDPLQRLLAERACERVVLDFVRRLSRRLMSNVLVTLTSPDTAISAAPAPCSCRSAGPPRVTDFRVTG